MRPGEVEAAPELEKVEVDPELEEEEVQGVEEIKVGPDLAASVGEVDPDLGKVEVGPDLEDGKDEVDPVLERGVGEVDPDHPGEVESKIGERRPRKGRRNQIVVLRRLRGRS